MGIRLLCILHMLDDSGPVRQELSSSEVPLRAREKEMHVRSSEGGWTSHSPNLYSGSVCRSAEAPASEPGTNSITDSWLAGECCVALGKRKKSLLSRKKDRGKRLSLFRLDQTVEGHLLEPELKRSKKANGRARLHYLSKYSELKNIYIN